MVRVLVLIIMVFWPFRDTLAIEGLPGWSAVSVSGETIGYGIIHKKMAPVLLLIPGSKCLPLFRFEKGKLHSRFHVTDDSFYKKFNFNVLALERVGIRSFSKAAKDVEDKDPRLRCTTTYGGLTLNDRVKDYLNKLKKLQNETWFGDLIFLGHSEGVDVALELSSRKELNVIAAGLFSGATTNQFLDLLVEQRKKNNPKAVFNVIDSLIWLTGSDATGKFGGYPINRFQSFTVDSTPLQSALKTSFPLYVVNGTSDKKAAIEGADAFVIELLRKQKKRIISYHNFEKLDHDFIDPKKQDQSKIVFGNFLEWAQAKNKKREFVIH